MYDITPKPLYDKKHNLSFFFTPKSACSFGVKWYFYQIGEYENCLNFSDWPHDYRTKVYNIKYNSKIDDDIFKTLSIFLVRNPLKRAVSSYIHTIKNSINFSLITKNLKKEINSNNTFSFMEFVEVLKNTDLNNCDPHWKIQTNKLTNDERFENKEILKAENLIDGLRFLEKKYDLKESPLDEINNSLKSHRRINESISGICFNLEFKIQDIIDNNIPDYKYFYNDKLINDVFNLYKCDFENYKYKPEI